MSNQNPYLKRHVKDARDVLCDDGLQGLDILDTNKVLSGILGDSLEMKRNTRAYLESISNETNGFGSLLGNNVTGIRSTLADELLGLCLTNGVGLHDLAGTLRYTIHRKKENVPVRRVCSAIPSAVTFSVLLYLSALIC